VSAKTGTTEFFSANWTLGWTPTLVNVVWVGNPSGSCLKPADRNNPAVRARLGDSLDDPLSPADLSHYGLSPKDDHCGHLEGSTGITGAAPIWHAYMNDALADAPKDWYPRPNDVTASGPGDDAIFTLPGTTGPPPGSGSGNPDIAGGGCYYYGPTADPSNPCRYVGATAPATGPSQGSGAPPSSAAPAPAANSPPAVP
jgi:membrane peptidoglycan carboxypeptidase